MLSIINRRDSAGRADDTVFYYGMFAKIKGTDLALCEVYEMPRAMAQGVVDASSRLREADRAFELREAVRNPDRVFVDGSGKDYFERWGDEVGEASNAYFDMLTGLKWGQFVGPEYPDDSILEKEQMAAFEPAKAYLARTREVGKVPA